MKVNTHAHPLLESAVILEDDFFVFFLIFFVLSLLVTGELFSAH